MNGVPHHSDPLPHAAGVGFKPAHFDALMEDPGPVAWLEVHAENYMGDGGRPIAQLEALNSRFALSLHGVGLSIGGDDALDPAHLSRLRRLVDRFAPASFSEHLAWSTHDSQFMNDLLPLPYTPATLAQVSEHVDQVQQALGCRMLLENPSSYLVFDESTLSEPDFLAAVVDRTGCGLLLDVNNVHVSATNLGFDSLAYLEAFPVEQVGEVHLGGHDTQTDEHGAPLLIDDHGREVGGAVWSLLEQVLGKTGPLPVLIEWDTDVPAWPVLAAEAGRAQAALDAVAA